MRDCVVAGSGWSGQRMERNRFWQSEQRVLHEAVCCGAHAAPASHIPALRRLRANWMTWIDKEDTKWNAY